MPSQTSSTQHSQLPVQGRLPWYLPAGAVGLETKEEELVSLRVENWGRGLKSGGELDFLLQFQLEFASKTGWLLQGYILVSFCPQEFLPL